MSFAHPIFLFGCLAALIPLLVHLFDRRRPRQVPFGAISFVLRSQKRTASRLKLKRLLLYALRTLILLALPIALARPELHREGILPSNSTGPSATAIVVDGSLSMRWADGKSNFERAREEARAALRELSPEEPATVVFCTAHPAPPGPPTFERARLMARVDELQPTFEPADLNRCLELAGRALEDSPLPGKRLVVVSDFCTSSLRLEAPPPTVQTVKGERIRPEVVLRDAAKSPQLPNRALVEVKAEPALQVGPRAWQFTFIARNFSAEAAKDVELQLKVDGQVVAKGFIDLPANGTAQKTLSHRFDGGGTAAVVEGVLAGDALAADDARAVVLPVPKDLKALIVNGSPSPQRYRDEAFFTEAALAAAGSPVRAVTRDSEAAWREDLSGYDVVLLLNVEAPAPEVAARLNAFVAGGGGLFLSVGDRVDPEAWNAALGPVLPRLLRVVKTAVDPNAPDATSRAAKLSQVALTHAVLAPFNGRAREGLMSARFFRYALLEGESAGTGGEVLASLDDGAPVLAVARKGKGRVALFTSTVDRDWSDFSIRTSFLPLIQRLGAWLAGALDEHEELKVHVGDSPVLKSEPPISLQSVRAPSGAELPQAKQNDGTVLVGPVTEPGAHLARDAEGKIVPALSFAASLDSAESDLTRHSSETVAQWFGEDTVRDAGGPSGPAPKVPLWTWLIIAATLAFFFEGVLLRK
jgi:hypothetical protein